MTLKKSTRAAKGSRSKSARTGRLGEVRAQRRTSEASGDGGRKRYDRIVKICAIEPKRVRLFAKKLGLDTKQRATGIDNVCHNLGLAMAQLFRGEGGHAYPVRVAGSGLEGLAFFMDDGTVIKAAEVFEGKERPRSRRDALVPGGRSISIGQFIHEISMTRKARKLYGRLFGVPKVMRSVVLRGAKGIKIAIMQQSLAPGTTLASFLRNASVPSEVRTLAARMHGKAVAALHTNGWAHGDIHSENVLVQWKAGDEKPKLSIIDWARANTLKAIKRKLADKHISAEALWEKFLRYESAFPYKDMVEHGPGRTFAEAYLDGYISGLAGTKHDIAMLAKDIRTDYHGLVNNNYMAMFQALRLVTHSLN